MTNRRESLFDRGDGVNQGITFNYIVDASLISNTYSLV